MRLHLSRGPLLRMCPLVLALLALAPAASAQDSNDVWNLIVGNWRRLGDTSPGSSLDDENSTYLSFSVEACW